jgi:hypothetical protein
MKTDECETTERLKIEIENPYNTWFNNVNQNYQNLTDIVSINGLSDAFRNDFSRGYTEDFYIPELYFDDEPCIFYSFGSTYVSYHSTLYGFSLKFRLIQVKDELYLRVYDNNNSLYNSIRMDYNINKDVADFIIYDNNEENITEYKADFDIVDRIVSNNVEYTDVIKITNNLLINKGKGFDITIIYLDKLFGLIKFEQKSGDIWDVIIE